MSNNPVFINIPVADLTKTHHFFSELGFSFRSEFTNELAACLILNDNTFVMLLTHEHFKQFTPLPIANAKQATEVLISFGAASREATDELVNKAIALGATEWREPQEYPFMYLRSFADLDGHIWEVGWMDEEKFKEAQTA